jgi:S-adenosylmethionine hydrolase
MDARALVLLTDFGSTDFYAGVMRSVLTSASPASSIVDLHHDIPAHDISAASFVLARAFEYLPPRAVTVCVVDPGVGTDRRGLVITVGQRALVCPDNGLASDLVMTTAESVSFFAIDEILIEREGIRPRGATFHGRDIFGPVAGMLAKGEGVARVARPVREIAMLSGVPTASVDGKVIHGRGRYVDRFGNVMTDIPVTLVRSVFDDLSAVNVAVAGHDAGPLRETYAQGRSGELMAIINSWGLVEVAMNGGRAVDYLGNVSAASIRFELRR